ncbi:hypothetical protein, partial [Halomonas caseinilytica]|uniref:hypothetical protein n=1 Tax=Halomonas caseinilytica TaxID=438744 RepID=UPI001CA53E6F
RGRGSGGHQGGRRQAGSQPDGLRAAGMIDAIKQRGSKIKRGATIGCAVAIMLLPSFFMDAALAAAIVVMALIGGESSDE